jgi:RNA polymerase sigma-70 factor (ECF subfamily)
VNHDGRDFASFYEASRDDCLRTVFASVGDREAAQDMVAEAFARAWASWRKVSKHPAPRAWVVRTALNIGVSGWRKRRHEQLRPGADRVALADAESMDGEVMRALLRLPERQRQVVALRILLDMGTAETATTLGIAPGTVKAHLSRGLATLRDELDFLRQEDR